MQDLTIKCHEQSNIEITLITSVHVGIISSNTFDFLNVIQQEIVIRCIRFMSVSWQTQVY